MKILLRNESLINGTIGVATERLIFFIKSHFKRLNSQAICQRKILNEKTKRLIVKGQGNYGSDKWIFRVFYGKINISIFEWIFELCCIDRQGRNHINCRKKIESIRLQSGFSYRSDDRSGDAIVAIASLISHKNPKIIIRKGVLIK